MPTSGSSRRSTRASSPARACSSSTKANVARGAYGPKGFEPGVAIPQGAEEISGADEMTRAARDQIAAGADVIKMYADYHYLPGRAEPPDA